MHNRAILIPDKLKLDLGLNTLVCRLYSKHKGDQVCPCSSLPLLVTLWLEQGEPNLRWSGRAIGSRPFPLLNLCLILLNCAWVLSVIDMLCTKKYMYSCCPSLKPFRGNPLPSLQAASGSEVEHTLHPQEHGTTLKILVTLQCNATTPDQLKQGKSQLLIFQSSHTVWVSSLLFAWLVLCCWVGTARKP